MRIISGNFKGKKIYEPKNKLIYFFPSANPAEPDTYTNGIGWPMGIFEIPIFNISDEGIYDKYGVANNLSSYKYEKLFNNIWVKMLIYIKIDYLIMPFLKI